MQNCNLLDVPEITRFLFQPPVAPTDDCPGNAQDVALTTAPGVSLCCRFYASAADAPTLFYCHAGNESCATFNGEAEVFVRHGMNVFLASYRGYGRSTGNPTVSSMLEDGRSLLPLAAEWLTAQGYFGARFVMGRSLGSVLAVDLVHVHGEKVKGLIIENGYCETASLLEGIGVPASALPSESEGFDTLGKIAGIKLPTMIFHGARNTLVPVAQAEKLQSAAGARNKQFFLIPGATHDDVGKVGGSFYYQKIKEFINAVCGVNTWRQRRREFKGRAGEGA